MHFFQRVDFDSIIIQNPHADFFYYNFHFSTVLEKFKTVKCSYGRVFRFWALTIPYFVITHPEDLQTVLSSQKHTKKVFFYKLLHNFLGNGLITSSGKLTKITVQIFRFFF